MRSAPTLRSAAAMLAVAAVLSACGAKTNATFTSAVAFDPGLADLGDTIRAAAAQPTTTTTRTPRTRATASHPASRTRPRTAVRNNTVERALATLINRARYRYGIGGVLLDPRLTRVARAHSLAMAGRAEIFHSRDLPSALRGIRWREAGENVGTGYNAPTVHAAFMRSETHKGNIVHPAYRYVGIGVVWCAASMYVTVIFIG
jgi:uncharacterized protein YkwD